MSPEKTEDDRTDENIVDEAIADTQDENDVQEETDIDPVSRLEAENAELREKLLRMAAENQNTRKRLVKQQQDAHKYRHQDILRDLAEVIDNFERAIISSTDSRDFDTFHEGILMIEKQFSGMLAERYGLERIGVEGEPFDPAAHEAMMMEESPDVESESVKQVYQAGYRLHDRVLRPAKVVIWKPAQTEDAGDGDKQESK
jgi:molecular chaperone GrpE